MSTSSPSPADVRPVARYNRTAMVLHWLVAALIVVNIAAGIAGVSAGKAPDAQRIIALHKSIGLTILGLLVLRILWRLAQRPPPLPARYPKAERVLAHAAHAALYTLMLLLPLTGYIHHAIDREPELARMLPEGYHRPDA